MVPLLHASARGEARERGFRGPRDPLRRLIAPPCFPPFRAPRRSLGRSLPDFIQHSGTTNGASDLVALSWQFWRRKGAHVFPNRDSQGSAESKKSFYKE